MNMKNAAYLLTILFMTTSLQAQTAIKAAILHTSAGEPIENGIVLIRDGVIERVGNEQDVIIPDGYTVYEAAVVTPGLIDAHTVVGLAGHYNQQGSDQDQLEFSSAIQPELRAIDAYNAQEALVGHLRSLGVTTVHTGHGPGALISGQTMIVKTSGETIDESVLNPAKMLAISLGGVIDDAYKTPGTRSKAIAMIRQQLINARAYAIKQKSKNPPPKNLSMEALMALLDGELTAMVTVHKASDIMSAIRLQEEFGFPMILDGVAEAYLITDHLKNAGFPVFIHPTMMRAAGEARNATMETAALLQEAGIPIAFQSGFEGYVPKTRVVLFEAALAVSYGLDQRAAMDALTIGAARLLDIDDKVGSIETGKDADLVLYDGDPFEYLTHVTHVFIDGKRVD